MASEFNTEFAEREIRNTRATADEALKNVEQYIKEIRDELNNPGFVRTDGLNSATRSLAHEAARLTEALSMHFAILRVSGINPKDSAAQECAR